MSDLAFFAFAALALVLGLAAAFLGMVVPRKDCLYPVRALPWHKDVLCGPCLLRNARGRTTADG